jgi:hypothetical protein
MWSIGGYVPQVVGREKPSAFRGRRDIQMDGSTSDRRVEAQLYRPSWIDRFTHWVDGIPVRAWIFYVVFGFVLILVQLLFLWLENGLRSDELLPVIFYNGLATPFLLALIHLLDHQALTAVNSMRPVMEATDSEFEQYKYSLANMPFLQPLIAGLSIAIIVTLMPLVTAEPIRYAALEGMPVFAVVFHIIDKSSAFLVGVIIYHTFRQLKLVNSISCGRIRINLFFLGPLQAFSRLTATTAVGLLVFMSLWMLINPDLLADPVNIGLTAVFAILTISVFVLPLYGVHTLMEAEKQRLLHTLDQHFDIAFTRFNKGFRDDDHAAIERLNRTISSLEIQHRKIEAIPTWPWRPETARNVLAAIALPLLLMIIQFLIERAFR